MITLRNDSYLFASLFFTTSFLIALIFILIVCVCNTKSKSFNKHKSFILSHDLQINSNNIDVAINDVNTFINDEKNEEQNVHKLKHTSLNRALPDIPQTSSSNIVHNNCNLFNSSTIELNDDVDSVYTTTNCNNSVGKNNEDNVQNHAYARIRNLITDSSTENDTDDYSDPTIIVNNSFQPHLINNLSENQNSNNAFDLQSHPDLLIRNENVEQIDIDNVETKREISYNTISVREPLAKVLAERDHVEHHYNEVEDERVSSFYEEINSGSVTYSKINEPVKENFQSLPSTSYQLEEMQSNIQNESNIPLYSLVDKKNKKFYNHQCNDDFVSNNIDSSSSTAADNLYTKVIKSKKEQSSNLILQRYSPPPPLPPPLNKDGQSKVHRNTIMFGKSSSNIFLPDQNFSTNYNPTTPVHSNLEKDPGYETVYKKIKTDENVNNGIDYGYEAISNDPAYEIVTIDNGYETIKNESSDLNDDQSDPNYEIISNIKTGSNIKTENIFSSNNILSCSVNSDENVVIIEHL